MWLQTDFHIASIMSWFPSGAVAATQCSYLTIDFLHKPASSQSFCFAKASIFLPIPTNNKYFYTRQHKKRYINSLFSWAGRVLSCINALLAFSYMPDVVVMRSSFWLHVVANVRGILTISVSNDGIELKPFGRQKSFHTKKTLVFTPRTVPHLIRLVGTDKSTFYTDWTKKRQ